MAVGKGSIKRASSAAKVNVDASAAGGEAVTAEEVKAPKETEAQEQNVKDVKKTTKKQAAKKTTAKTANKTAAKLKTKTAEANKATQKPAEKEEKSYEVVEGITCNIARYLL